MTARRFAMKLTKYFENQVITPIHNTSQLQTFKYEVRTLIGISINVFRQFSIKKSRLSPEQQVLPFMNPRLVLVRFFPLFT